MRDFRLPPRSRLELRPFGLLRSECNNSKGRMCQHGQCRWCVQVLRSPKEAFAAAMQSWRERCEKCVCLQGDYVEK